MLFMFQINYHSHYIILWLLIPGIFYFFSRTELCYPIGITCCTKNIHHNS